MMPAPPVSLAPGELEAKHKRELRRQIALHYVQVSYRWQSLALLCAGY